METMDMKCKAKSGRRPSRGQRGTALVASMILSFAVAAMVTAYLAWGRAEVRSVKIPTARARALYQGLGQLALARMLILRSAYDEQGDNLVLNNTVNGRIPGTQVEVQPMAGTGNDPYGIFFTLRTSVESEGVRVTLTQLVAERESFTNYLALVHDANLGITGILDENYDPKHPPTAPPAPLSKGKIHTNKQMELYFPGYRHYVNPITGGIAGGDWVYKVGAEKGKQIFWYADQSRPDAKAVPFPDLAAYSAMKSRVTSGAPAAVSFEDAWAVDMVTRNENGYHVSGDVDVLVEFGGPDGTFSLTLRERSGEHRISTVSGLQVSGGNDADTILFVENGYDPDAQAKGPNQTVHVKGNLNGRMTVFAPTGNVRIAGSIRYVDASGAPAAKLDAADGLYKANPAYAGTSTLGLLAEFDVRYGIKPNTPTWPKTTWYIDAKTGQWKRGNLGGQPVGPSGQQVPVVENLFGYLGGETGTETAEVHASVFCRQGRVYADGMNPLNYTNDSWGYRVGWNGKWVTPYAQATAALYRFGSTVTRRRPVNHLVDSRTGKPLIGWGSGESTFDESLVENASPYFFRHNRPVFYMVQIANGGEK